MIGFIYILQCNYIFIYYCLTSNEYFKLIYQSFKDSDNSGQKVFCRKEISIFPFPFKYLDCKLLVMQIRIHTFKKFELKLIFTFIFVESFFFHDSLCYTYFQERKLFIRLKRKVMSGE